MEEHDNMDYFYQQILQKDVSRRLQVGQDLIDYLNDPHRSPDVEQDKPRLDKTIDELKGWVNSSNYKVRYLIDSQRMRVDCSSHPSSLLMNYFPLVYPVYVKTREYILCYVIFARSLVSVLRPLAKIRYFK